MADGLKVAMISPNDSQCGIKDYSSYLVPELLQFCDVQVYGNNEFDKRINEADIIHIQHQYFLFGGVAPWKNRFHSFLNQCQRPVVITAHEYVPPIGNPVKMAAIKFTNQRQFGSTSIRKIIVHTKNEKRQMVSNGFASSRIEVLRHPIPPICNKVDPQYAKARLGLTGRRVLTIFGFISQRKGYEYVLDILPDLPDDVVFLIAGGKHPQDTTGYADNLMQQIQAVDNSNDRIRMTGYLNDEQVSNVMSATDLAIAPFTDSSGSGSFALAIAWNKPILASDIPAHREILNENPGLFESFNTTNSSDFRNRLLSLLDDYETRASFSKAARSYCEQNSYHKMANTLSQMYREILETGQ